MTRVVLFCADWPADRVRAALAEHVPSRARTQCRCGAVPVEACWQRAELAARLAELEATADA